MIHEFGENCFKQKELGSPEADPCLINPFPLLRLVGSGETIHVGKDAPSAKSTLPRGEDAPCSDSSATNAEAKAILDDKTDSQTLESQLSDGNNSLACFNSIS